MEIKVNKITGKELLRLAASYTIGKDSKLSLKKGYKCEHSPIRTQIFIVEMINIPTFVSVHFVRHNVGVTHFVTSNRDDRGGTGTEDRNTEVKHMMIINAQSLIAMARKRLCFKSHRATVNVMRGIKKVITDIDHALFERLVPECIYRGLCPEIKSCGHIDSSTYEHQLKEYKDD